MSRSRIEAKKAENDGEFADRGQFVFQQFPNLWEDSFRFWAKFPLFGMGIAFSPSWEKRVSPLVLAWYFREKEEARRDRTVEALTKEYLDDWAKPRKRSWRKDEQTINAEIIPRWGRRKAKSITRNDVRELLATIVDRGARVRANRVLALVRKMFNYALERDLVEANPCQGIRRPSAETPRDRALSLEEAGEFLARIDTAPMSVPNEKAGEARSFRSERVDENRHGQRPFWGAAGADRSGDHPPTYWMPSAGGRGECSAGPRVRCH
jgi:hypothetical protein